MREITSIWQTDELRRYKPTPVEEAKAGKHLAEDCWILHALFPCEVVYTYLLSILLSQA